MLFATLQTPESDYCITQAHLAEGIEGAKLDKKTSSSIARQITDRAILECGKTSSYIVYNILSSFMKVTLCL